MWDYLEKDGFLWTSGCGCCASSKHIDEAELKELEEFQANLMRQLEEIGLRIGFLTGAKKYEAAMANGNRNEN